MTAGASRTAPDPPNNSSSLTRARPGCATPTSYAGASAAVFAPSPTGGQFSTPIGGQNWTPIDTFLAVPRFASYARGAATLIVSDGLERGDPLAFADAVAKLSRRAWRLSWLTPLARGRNFKPQTEALIAVSRFVDDMVDGGSTPAIVDHVLALGRKRAA